jgi:capsular polysaccharide transport system ATP-binding protein
VNEELAVRGVRFEHVSRIDRRKSDNPQLILDDVSGYFPADRSTGILCIEAASLTTLVRLITGAIFPTRGIVSRDCRVSFPLAYSSAFSRNLSGLQNLRFLARIYGADVNQVTEFVARFSGLDDKLKDRASTYKGDNWARFLMAASYALPFEMYVADGKLVAGPPAFREKCKAYIQHLRQSSGMIIATMQPTIIRQFCDRVYVLDGGKLIPFEKIGDGIRYFAPLRASYINGHESGAGHTIEETYDEDDDDLAGPDALMNDL